MLRSPSVLRSAVLSVALIGAVGCEDRGSANKDVIDKLTDGLGKVAQLPDLSAGDQLTAANTSLASAAGEKAAGPGFQAVAAAAVADLDQQAAFVGATRLKSMETDVRRTLVRLRRLGDQLATTAMMGDAYAKSDPKSAVDDLSGHISAIQGNAQSLTWGGESVGLPTLAAAKQDAAKLDGEINDRKGKIDEMQKQRTELLATAEQQAAHADQVKGEESVKAFGDSAESRRKADDLAIQIDVAQAKLSQVQADADVLKGQTTTLDSGIKTLQDQGQLIESNWGALQKHAQGQKAVASAILEGDEQSKISIKQVSGELKKQLDDLATARSTVLGQLTEAEKYATTAGDQARQLSQGFADKLTTPGKEADAYKNLRGTVNQQQYQYVLGTVRRDLGNVSTSQATLLNEVKATIDGVKAAVSAAGLASPSDLDAIDTSAVTQLTDGAETSLTNANGSLTNVETGADASEKLKADAKVARLINFQSHLRLLDLKDMTGDTGAKAAATQMMSDAVALKADLQASNVPLPGLPGDLGKPAEPATQPTTPPA